MLGIKESQSLEDPAKVHCYIYFKEAATGLCEEEDREKESGYWEIVLNEAYK